MKPLAYLLYLIFGQSNQQGASLNTNSGAGFRFTCRHTGNSEPYAPNNNGGGSCLPRLEELCADRGIRLIIRNCAVGSSSILHWTGVQGATVSGSSTTPWINKNMSGSSLVGGTGIPCKEGDPGFDPYGFLAKSRDEVLKFPQFPLVVTNFANAESDGALRAHIYQAAHESIARYCLGTMGAVWHGMGLSASGINPRSAMENLSAGQKAALAVLQAEGLQVYQDADLYAEWGMNPPFLQERGAPGTRVHLTGEAQGRHAELRRDALVRIGLVPPA